MRASARIQTRDPLLLFKGPPQLTAAEAAAAANDAAISNLLRQDEEEDAGDEAKCASEADRVSIEAEKKILGLQRKHMTGAGVPLPPVEKKTSKCFHRELR